ncbi:unnamed protein product [Lasius platythorax]
MVDDLKDLLVEQSTIIASIKRVLANFKKIGKANVTQYKVKKRLENLEALWEKCQRQHVRLLQVATAEEQRTVGYFSTDEFFAAEDDYHESADHLADIIVISYLVTEFSGKFAEWENFRGIFESLVASKESLSNTQKLHYLKASVTGATPR